MGKEEFDKVLNELRELLINKNNDYSENEDYLSNFKMAEKLGICSSETGILTRITDKLARVTQLLKKEQKVNDESIEDTLKDMANYAVILVCLLREKRKNNAFK